ncbi:hypothetical protein DL95DRAFT_501038 [Leptodontidium sp. 2 PMI_412]|nr:hypothetical protein DL95DRAFT_501038 [Leptodontidium sp. 2 PMI_412]
MAATGPQAILNGSSIGATNAVDNVRIFAQDTSLNIRQSIFQQGIWSGGKASDVIANAKSGSPIEVCIQAAPDSDIAAFTAADSTDALLSVIYFQAPDNHIQEYVYHGLSAPTISIFHADFPRGEKDGWVPGHSFDQALAGTRIATFLKPGSSGFQHVYFQDTAGKVIEWGNTAAGWGKGLFLTAGNAPASPCALAAVRTMTWDGVSWFLASIVGTATNPNAQLAVAAWQGKTLGQTRIYFQDEKNGTAVAEYKRTDTEWLFLSSVPPLT